MGKLSREDWRAVDRELRGEAIEILRELDRLEGRSPEEEGRSPEEAARSREEEARPEADEDRLPERERQRPSV
jgi:hypothetical protein